MPSENTARQNIVANPSFETNTTGWAGTGSATVARVTTDYVFGAACLEVTKAAASNSGVALSSRASVAATESYAVSAYVKVPTGDEDAAVQLKLEWFTATTGGSSISSTTGELTTVTGGSDWVRLGKIATAPAGALGLMVSIIQPTAGTASEKFLVDGVLLENDDQINLYTEDRSQDSETTVAKKALTPLPPPVFTGLKLNADVQLGSLVFNAIDENNVIWIITDIKGWWEHPEPEVPDIPRGWGDGSYDVRGRWQARQITLEGVFLPPDPSYVAAARAKLIEATSLVYSNAWLYVNEGPVKAARVRLSGKPDIQTVNARGRTEFSVGLRAGDPIKYGWNWENESGYYTQTVPSTNASASETGVRTITVAGNTEVTALFEITGPMTGPGEIYNAATDDLLTIVQPLRDATTRTVTNKALTSGVATLTTSVAHGFIADDVVEIDISDAAFDGTRTVVGVPTTTTFTFVSPAANVASGAASGNASIDTDVLEVDTYTQEVTFNTRVHDTRSMVDTLVDWIKLAPGDNEITFEDTGNADGDATLVIRYRPGWIG